MKRTLVVVDMQYDFIDGALANPVAAVIVPGIAKEIKNGGYDRVIFTRDTHYEDNYFKTPEGKHLPIMHCGICTHGWRVHQDLVDAALSTGTNVCFVDKLTFGSLDLATAYCTTDEEITLVGTCTDICVLNNAIILKTLGGEVNVIANLCAGLTPELHDAALKIMEHNHINIK